MNIAATQLWLDVAHIPEVLESTAQADGLTSASKLMRSGSTRRLVAVGNGASSYIAQALWLASLEGETRPPVDVVAIPAGLLGTGRLRWTDEDAILAISASGEARDLIAALQALPPSVQKIAVTSSPDSTIAGLCDAVITVATAPQRTMTHSHAYCGAAQACLSFWAEVTGDAGLRAAVDGAAQTVANGLERSVSWAEHVLDGAELPTAAFAFGAGTGWAAAMEASLLVKELAQIPGEGVELREAATTVMTTLQPGHLVVDLTPHDPAAGEADAACEGRGARVVRIDQPAGLDSRLAPISTFTDMTALATGLALAAGRDPDTPAWTDTYLEVARPQGAQNHLPAPR